MEAALNSLSLLRLSRSIPLKFSNHNSINSNLSSLNPTKSFRETTLKWIMPLLTLDNPNLSNHNLNSKSYSKYLKISKLSSHFRSYKTPVNFSSKWHTRKPLPWVCSNSSLHRTTAIATIAVRCNNERNASHIDMVKFLKYCDLFNYIQININNHHIWRVRGVDYIL